MTNTEMMMMIRPHEVHPERFEWVEVADLQEYCDDDRFVMQQKLDGMRLQVRLANGRVSFIGANGKALAAAAAAQYFPALERAFLSLPHDGLEAVFDGEIMLDGTYWVFDLPMWRACGVTLVEPTNTLAVRRLVLESLIGLPMVQAAIGAHVRVLGQVVGAVAKRALADLIEERGAEGVMLKRTDAPYLCGATVRHSVKIKYRKTADCIVVARDTPGSTGQATKSAQLAVWEDGRLLPVGRCSMIGKPDAQPGDVVEVAYLYATPNTLPDGRSTLTLYQPSLFRMRPDKAADACRLAQLVPVDKSVVPV